MYEITIIQVMCKIVRVTRVLKLSARFLDKLHCQDRTDIDSGEFTACSLYIYPRFIGY